MDYLLQFTAWQWLVFLISGVIAFGVLNGLYSVSRLIQRGGLPVHFWIFNGFAALIIALGIAGGSY